MRKVIELLDSEQREALLELADFGTAAFSSGLVVSIVQRLVELLTG
jgi:hypothetical protein